MTRKPAGRSATLRQAIAQEAARLMVERGIHDFLLAKRKAAERFGVTDAGVLPRNTEIEAALIAHQRLFGQDSHAENLHRLRKAAVQAMSLLAEFQPRLIGPVLTGTATEHADVQLHVFADRAESLTLLLLDRHLPYELVERRLRLQADRPAVSIPGLRFDLDAAVIEVLVFAPDGIRQSPVSPVDGKPMRRANVDEVRALLVGNQALI